MAAKRIYLCLSFCLIMLIAFSCATIASANAGGTGSNDATLAKITLVDPDHPYYRKTISSPMGEQTDTETVSGYINSLLVKAYPTDGSALVQIDGSGQPYNGKTLNLGVGDNSCTVSVTSSDGTATEVYTLKIIRAQDDTLKSIGVSAGSLSPSFDPDVLEYSVNVDSGVKSFAITPQAFDSNVSIKLGEDIVQPGQSSQPIPLSTGMNDISMQVKSSDGSLSRAYVLHIQRADWSWQQEGLSYSVSSMGRVFPAVVGDIPYLIAVDSGKITIERCTGTSWDMISQCTVPFSYVNSFSADTGDFYLQLDDKLLKFNGSGWDTLCYLPVSHIDVEGLVVSDGVPYISYHDGVVFKRLHVDKFMGHEWVSVGSGSPVDDNGYFGSDLEVSSGNIYVAYKGIDSVNRKIFVKEFDGTTWMTLGGEGFSPCTANSFSLKIDEGTPYLAYEYYLDNPTAGVLKFDGTNWLAINSGPIVDDSCHSIGLAVDNGNPYVALTYGYNSLLGVYDISNGSWNRLGNVSLSFGSIENLIAVPNFFLIHGEPCFLININGYSMIKYQPSNDDSLMRVGLASPEGIPAYSDSVVVSDGSQDLSIKVPSYLSSAVLDPAPADRYSTVTINGDSLAYGCMDTVKLNAGDNVFAIKVVSCDGSASKDYTLTITKPSDASLNALTIDAGSLTPAFNPGITSYSLTVDGTVDTIHLSATPSDSTATVQVDGNSVTAWPAAIPLKTGENYVNVSVTSGTNTLDYTLDVTRTPYTWQDMGSSLPNMSSMSFDDIGGMPYIAFISGGYLQVRRYDGTAWVAVGDISQRAAYFEQIAIDKELGTVYVYYSAFDGPAKFMEYTPDGWKDIDVPSGIGSNALCACGGSLYTAYVSGNEYYVSKYDGAQWVSLGDSGFSKSGGSPSLMVTDGIPYIASPYTNSLIRRFTGSVWEDAGDTSVLGGAKQIALAKDGNCIYAAITGGTRTGNDIAVMKLTTAGWEQVGGLLHVSDNYLSDLKLTADGGIPCVASYSGYNHVIVISQCVGDQWSNLGAWSNALYYSYSTFPGATLASIEGAAWYAYLDANGTAELLRWRPVYSNEHTGILVSAPPTKTVYIEGEYFDPAGMTVMDSNNDVVTEYSISPGGALTTTDNKVTIGFGTLTVDQTITVHKKSLDHISITKQPTKTIYVEGETFDPVGMVVTAYYDNGMNETLTDYSIEPSGTLGISDSAVVVSYDGQTVEQDITVLSKGSLIITCEDNTGAILPGVSLDIYSDNGMAHKVGGGVSDGTTGNVIVTELDSGTYYVVVSSVPAGYGKPSTDPQGYAVIAGNITNVTLKFQKFQYSSRQLKDIQISIGDLSSAFDPDVTQYTLTLDEETSSTVVTPILFDPMSKLFINGRAVSSKRVTLSETGSSMKLTIEVRPKSGKSNYYYVTVLRAKSTDATLASLKASKGQLSEADATHFTVSLSNTQTSTKISFTLNNKYAKYAMTLDGKSTSNKTVSLKPGTTRTLVITVTPQAGSGYAVRYTVQITRAISHNNDIASLTTSRGPLSRAFTPGYTGDYQFVLTSAQSSVTLKVKLEDSTAKYSIKVNGKASGSTINLAKGATKMVAITVTSQAGEVKTYTITISRAS